MGQWLSRGAVTSKRRHIVKVKGCVYCFFAHSLPMAIVDKQALADSGVRLALVSFGTTDPCVCVCVFVCPFDCVRVCCGVGLLSSYVCFCRSTVAELAVLRAVCSHVQKSRWAGLCVSVSVSVRSSACMRVCVCVRLCACMWVCVCVRVSSLGLCS